MKLTEVLNREPTSLSFEVFPPKPNDDFEKMAAAIDEIAALKPAYMSVTYGAGGSKRQNETLKTAVSIQKKYGVPTLAHLTCVSATKEEIKDSIQALKNAGIENVLALRGDIPDGTTEDDRKSWGYPYAAELVKELRKDGGFCIGAACYPEVHPESRNSREDIARLKEKVDAGCDFLTTQMFFDNNLLYSFLYKIREAGITVPVVPGVMPITNANFVKRSVELSGAFMPQRFKSLIDRFGSDKRAMMQAGIAYATDQIIDLFACGIRHVHVYSMNNPKVASAILQNLSDIIGKL